MMAPLTRFMKYKVAKYTLIAGFFNAINTCYMSLYTDLTILDRKKTTIKYSYLSTHISTEKSHVNRI